MWSLASCRRMLVFLFALSVGLALSQSNADAFEAGWFEPDNDETGPYPRRYTHHVTACPGYPGPEDYDIPMNAVANVTSLGGIRASSGDENHDEQHDLHYCWDIFSGSPHSVPFTASPNFWLEPRRYYQARFDFNVTVRNIHMESRSPGEYPQHTWTRRWDCGMNSGEITWQEPGFADVEGNINDIVFHLDRSVSVVRGTIKVARFADSNQVFNTSAMVNATASAPSSARKRRAATR